MIDKKQQSGSVLLEALVATMLLVTGIVGLMGLQATAFSDVSQAKYRMDAGFLANQIIADMWVGGAADVVNYGSATGTLGSKSQAWLAQVEATLPGASSHQPTIVVKDVTDASGSKYEVTVTVNWQPPKESITHSYVGSTFINRNN